MKQKFFIVALIALMPLAADAQLNNILNKVKNKAKQRGENKVDQQIDKTLDEIEGKKKAAPAPEASETKSTEREEQPATLKSFSKYDFIPGDSVLYYDAFEGEALSELPTGWNTTGTGEVATFEKFPGNWLRLHKPFTYLTSNQSKFGENYTLEFDVILQLKNNGWGFPALVFGMVSSGDESNTSNEFLRDYKRYGAVVVTVMPNDYSGSKVRLNSFADRKDDYKSDNKAYEPLEKSFGRPFHIAVQVQKERFRMWINQDKIFDVPKGVPLNHIMNQLFFEVTHTNYPEDQYGVYVSNIKVATGRPDTRHKLIEEGKFSTTGILFDFQSAEIKPESYAVVKEISGVLKDNESVRIKVLGHTSSDGDDNANMELSKKRAASVKNMLVNEFAIDASRIETEGMGETKPVADNKTKEGKVLNRRVEFVKL
jgi:outer membrane protein OmpA-like peptidoglycan-associated protein